MSTVSRPRASFGAAKKNTPEVLARAQTMHDHIAANPAAFASPTVSMVAFLALITGLTVAQQTVTSTKAKGSGTQRNTRRDGLWTAMESLRTYVQGLADVLAAEAAASLIEAAGLVVASVPVHQKPLLTAKLTTTPGVVHLDANRSLLAGPAAGSRKIVFNWQWSGDGGKSWNDAHATAYANTDVPGLALMSTYSFRVSIMVGKDKGAWSQPVSLLVH